MKKRIFLLFFGIIGLLVAATVWFIQSPRFASLLKHRVARYLPADLGLEADFTELGVKLFPPGLSLRNPSIVLNDHNILQMPAGSSVRAERIDLNFQAFQMFSGDIRVHEVAIVNGDATIIVAPSAPVKKRQKKLLEFDFHWDELFQVRAEAVSLQNTKINIVVKDSRESLGFLAQSLRLGQWSSSQGLGYELLIELGSFEGSLLEDFPAARALNQARIFAHINKSGIRVDDLSVKADGLTANATGLIQGDLLNSKESKKMELDVKAEGDLTRVSSLAAKDSASALMLQGTASFQGKVRSLLERFPESLRAEGTLAVTNPSYQKWKADRFTVEGSYGANAEGGEIQITRGVIEGTEQERTGAAHPGYGGKVEIGQVKLDLANPGPVTVPLTLRRAHVQWLAAPELKAVYPLQLRATGPVEVQLTPSRGRTPWRVAAKVDLSISDFQLDNQRLTLVKPMHRVLNIPKFGLQGTVLISPAGLVPEGVMLQLPTSRIRVEGKVDKTGYDLHGYGRQVSLSEIGHIAENPITGDGSLDIHVHGPASKLFLDFDTDLKNASYLNLKYGDLKGRITWDDDPDHLILNKLQGYKGQTRYTADGMVDLSAAQSLAINIVVGEGNIHDFTGIFENLTKDFWWFPHGLNGAMTGEVRVFGGVTMKKLEVLARLSGKGWENLGERFDTVSLTGGYDKGRYHISDFKSSKHSGRFTGRLSYDSEERFDWDFHTQQFTISDLDHVAQLDVPIRGKLFIDSVGKGKIGAIQSNSQVLISDVAVRGVPMPPSQLFLKSENGKLEVKANALGGQGSLDASYDFDPGATSYIRADLTRIDFSPVLLLLNPRTIPDPAVQGFMSGSANLSFRSGAFERATGTLEMREYLLAKTDARFRLAHPVSLKITDGSFDLKELALAGNHGEAKLHLRGRKAELEGSVTGGLDASIAEFFTSSVSQASGVALLDFAISGNLRSPLIVGKGTFDGISLRVPGVESPFENITGGFKLQQNVIQIQDLESDLAGGRAIAGGSITLFADRYPTLALKGTLAGTRLKIFPFQYAKVRGSLQVTGSELPYNIDGSVIVESALSKEKVFQQRQGQSLKVAQYTPPPSTRRLSDYPRFKLNIDVKAESGILVQNDLFDVDLKAQIKVVNTLDAPRILGNIDLVQGKMVFKDRAFQIHSASATFDSPTVINPRFSLTAGTDVNGVKVQLYASGRIDKWKVELSSTPVMAESEIISLLALGMTSTDSKKLSTGDRTAFEQGEAASLILHSLDFNREVESKTGIQIQLDESVNTQQGTSIFRPQSSTEAAAAPKIVFKRQITKNLDVSYGSTVGVGATSQKQINAEVKVTPSFSILGVYDSYETVEAKDKQSSTSSQSYGLDLKVQKRFK